MIIASNIKSKNLFKYYLKRWNIESLFKYLKTHGFNFEDTHLTDSRKLEALIFVLTLSVTWALVVSQSLKKKEPLKIASHGRKRKSFFKRGFEAIRRSVLGISQRMQELIECCRLIISELPSEVVLKWGRKRTHRKRALKTNPQLC